jgi:hypothetical protein
MKAVEFWMDGMEKVARAWLRAALHCGSGSALGAAASGGAKMGGGLALDMRGR